MSLSMIMNNSTGKIDTRFLTYKAPVIPVIYNANASILLAQKNSSAVIIRPDYSTQTFFQVNSANAYTYFCACDIQGLINLGFQFMKQTATFTIKNAIITGATPGEVTTGMYINPISFQIEDPITTYPTVLKPYETTGTPPASLPVPGNTDEWLFKSAYLPLTFDQAVVGDTKVSGTATNISFIPLADLLSLNPTQINVAYKITMANSGQSITNDVNLHCNLCFEPVI